MVMVSVWFPVNGPLPDVHYIWNRNHIAHNPIYKYFPLSRWFFFSVFHDLRTFVQQQTVCKIDKSNNNFFFYIFQSIFFYFIANEKNNRFKCFILCCGYKWAISIFFILNYCLLNHCCYFSIFKFKPKYDDHTLSFAPC